MQRVRTSEKLAQRVKANEGEKRMLIARILNYYLMWQLNNDKIFFPKQNSTYPVLI